jgi:hypothetical protein
MRLIIAAAIWIAVGVAVAGVLLSAVFKDFVVAQFNDQLHVNLDELERLIEVGADGQLKLQRPLSDPRYEAHLSGAYWEIQKNGTVLARSPSLEGPMLKVPPGRGENAQTHTYRIEGPTGELMIAEHLRWLAKEQVPTRIIIGAALLFDQLWNDTTAIHPDAVPETPEGLEALLVPSHSRRCQQRLACLHAGLIERSQRYLALTSPYFAPGALIEMAFRNAAARGVEVRLLVPRKGDPPIAGWATRAAYESLLAAGVRVYEYLTRKLHAKALVIDGEWSVIGSANFDRLSLFVNQELILIARDRNLAEALRVQHEEDVGNAAQVMPSQWRLRGWRERGLELIGRAARRLL